MPINLLVSTCALPFQIFIFPSEKPKEISCKHSERERERDHCLCGLEMEGSLSLPPGFRFHPTDEELITYYLTRKVSDYNFLTGAIVDVDLNKCEPWDLPGTL